MLGGTDMFIWACFIFINAEVLKPKPFLKLYKYLFMSTLFWKILQLHVSYSF